MNTISIIFLGLFVIARELSEHSKDSRWPVNMRWWNTKTAWKNKHEWHKWIFKDVLVFVTDAEHFFQWLSHIFIALVFIPFGWWKVLMAWAFVILLSGLSNRILKVISR